jgi:hypothetical protein
MVVLFFVDGESPTEIAELIGIPVGDVMRVLEPDVPPEAPEGPYRDLVLQKIHALLRWKAYGPGLHFAERDGYSKAVIHNLQCLGGYHEQKAKELRAKNGEAGVMLDADAAVRVFLETAALPNADVDEAAVFEAAMLFDAYTALGIRALSSKGMSGCA